MSTLDLFKKYDVPAPRYTSYPTVPYWEKAPATEEWLHHLEQTLQNENSSWSLYIHVPFCETLCTYCGCNTSITKNHQREAPYVDLLLKEWKTYVTHLPSLKERTLKALHLGGGTPTFLSAPQLKRLISEIMNELKIDPKNFEGSIEVDPRRTNDEQLQVLRELGFNRLSLGVQDFDPEVQRLVNRIQPYEITARMTQKARELGYVSINFDLIYGLAKQNLDTIQDTIQKTIELRPDRIALYSLALVPWIKPAQRLFKDEDLPMGAEKRALYERAREMLLAADYVEVGMDHFALPSDSLARAMNERELHRNFMGYTDQKTEVLLGLGVSAISETPTSFHQNEKVLPVYEEKVKSATIPTFRGHILSDMDRRRRRQILQFMTNFEVELESAEQVEDARKFLNEMIQDDLVHIENNKLILTEKGRPFLRNACVFFDQRLRDKQPTTNIFSKAL